MDINPWIEVAAVGGAYDRMSAVMRLISRSVRGLAGVALLLLAGGRTAQALTVLASSVTPAGPVPLNTVLTVTATLYAETPGNLVRLTAAPGDKLSCTAYNFPFATGTYALLANDPLLVSNTVPSGTLLDFQASATQWVQWQFTTTRTGTVSFSVLADDELTGNVEGCDASRFNCLPVFFNPGPGTCSLGAVQIVSNLDGRANAEATLARPPNTIYPEDQFEVVQSLTNTGGGSITVSAVVASTLGTDSTLVVAPVSAPAAPGTLTSGSSAMATWVYAAAADALPGQHIRFWTDAERTLAYTTTLYVAAAPLTLTATLLVDPDGPGILDTVPAGATYPMLADEIQVVADVTNTSGVYAVDVDPVVDVADNNGTGGADFKPTAARNPAPGPVSVPPFTTRRFTWTYALDRNDYYQSCNFTYPDMTYTVRTRGLALLLDQPVLAQAFAASLSAPSVVQLGETYSATVWLTNTADRPVTVDASATVYLDLGGAPMVAVVGAPVPGNRTLGTGQAAGYVFTLQATSAGTQPYTAGVRFGTSFNFPCPGVAIGSPAAGQTEVVAPSPFVPTLLSSTNAVNSISGANNTTTYADSVQYFLTLAVFNSSTCSSQLDHVTPNDVPSDLQESPYAGPSDFGPNTFTCAQCPTLPCTIAAGTTAYFTATVTGSVGCGDVDWTGTMTGAWGAACGSAPFSRPYTSARIHLRQIADITNTDSVHPYFLQSSAIESQNFQLVLKVTPAGENPVNNFTVALAPHTAPGAAFSLVSAPVIPSTLAGCGGCVTNLCPASAQSFTWTFKADAKGTGNGDVWFTLTASGNDPYGITKVQTMSFSTTGRFKILKPSVVTASVWSEPDTQSGGTCRVNAVLDAVVVGDTAMSLTVYGQPKIVMTSTDGGTALAAGLPDVVTLLQPGDNFFTWTYTPTGAGDLGFTASVTAQESTLWTPQTSTAATTNTYPVRPGVLTASVWVDRSVVTTAAGQVFNVVLKVMNTGNVPSGSVLTATIMAEAGGCGGACTGTPLKWPILSTTAFPDVSDGIFGCGDAAYYYWTFTTTLTGEGCVAFTATISGTVAGSPSVAGNTSGCLTIVPRPPAQARLVSVSPESVLPGKDFYVSVELKNTGATAIAMNPQPSLLKFSDSDNMSVVASSIPSLVSPIAAYGGTVVFKARVLVSLNANIGPATIGFSPAPFTASDLVAKGSVPVDASAGTVTVTVIPPAASVVAQENPWHPLKGPLPVRYITPDGGKVLLEIYNIEGRPVRKLVDEEKASGDYTVLWDGKNEDGQVIAAGIYLLRYETKGLKTTKKLAVVK